MVNSGLLDPSRTFLEGADIITMNERTRYSTSAQSVSGGTIPTNFIGQNWFQGAGTPTTVAFTSNMTLTAFQLSKGICVLNASTSGFTVTMDTASNIVGMVNQQSAGAQVGDVLQVLVINGGASSFTFLPGTGGSNDTNVAQTSIPATSSRLLNIRLNAVTDLIGAATSGSSCSYTIYF